MISKFAKNLEFICENPEFICDKLSKMSKILSSYIVGIKKIEKEVDNTDFETLKRYVHSLMLSTTNLNENLYIVNLVIMMLLNNPSFREGIKDSIESIIKIVESQDHESSEESQGESHEEIKKEVKEVQEVKEEEEEEVKEEPKPVPEKIEVRMIEATEIKEEPVTTPDIKIRKKRGRKKKSESR